MFSDVQTMPRLTTSYHPTVELCLKYPIRQVSQHLLGCGEQESARI
jgi:hypothetical protein